MGKIRTNVGFKLKFGKDVRMFRLEFISNSPISESEFHKWRDAVRESIYVCDLIFYTHTGFLFCAFYVQKANVHVTQAHFHTCTKPMQKLHK